MSAESKYLIHPNMSEDLHLYDSQFELPYMGYKEEIRKRYMGEIISNRSKSNILAWHRFLIGKINISPTISRYLEEKWEENV